jgi:hypothetical protein
VSRFGAAVVVTAVCAGAWTGPEGEDLAAAPEALAPAIAMMMKQAARLVRRFIDIGPPPPGTAFRRAAPTRRLPSCHHRSAEADELRHAGRRGRIPVVQDNEKEEIGKLAGMGAGMLSGARIGSAIPIPLVGSFAGAVIGGVLGSEVGKKFGKAIINGATEFVDTLKGDAAESKSDRSDPDADQA